MIFVYGDTRDPVIVRSIVDDVEGWSVNVDDGADYSEGGEPFDSEWWDGEQILFQSRERLERWAAALSAAVAALPQEAPKVVTVELPDHGGAT